MKSKQRQKRRSRPSLGRRIRTFWILIFVVFAGAAYGTWTLVQAPMFHLATLSVTGLSRVSRAQVVAKAAIDRHENVWLLDKSAIETRIETIPYVGTARVHRLPVGNIRIDVTERVRDGCARSRDGIEVTIDAERRVLEAGCADDSLPKYSLVRLASIALGAFINDATLSQLQADAHALASDGRRYEVFQLDAFGDLEATMPDGIRVRFGEDDDLARKDRLVGPILTELGPRVGDVASVDLRAPTTPVVQFRPPAPTPASLTTTTSSHHAHVR